MPIDDAQKEVLRKRLELARASKVAKKQKINDVVQAPKAEVVVDEPKQVQEEEVVSVATTVPMAKEPLVELPKKAKSEGRNEDTKGAFSKKDRYAKLVFYKDPSQKTIKKMTSILASSDDDEPPKAQLVNKQVNIAPPTPQIKPQPQIDPKLLRQQQISNLSKRFFDC
jgi:hypothetical protein